MECFGPWGGRKCGEAWEGTPVHVTLLLSAALEATAGGRAWPALGLTQASRARAAFRSL